MYLDAKAYLTRAEECARLAKLTMDCMIQRRLLELRQEYLGIARGLDSDPGYSCEAVTLVIRAAVGLPVTPKGESAASTSGATG